ncbi:MAG: 2-oxoacid:acceptor oxidoreductase subunit alpha [Candidatus Eisenbacteria bacterium]|nr:2-oxoacid:acceptor oxidoreductase subunit alpha [Candidatus Eisenbacteria bacterium]
MSDLSVLIAGKAGDGINQAGLLLSRLLSELGHRIYMSLDYQSLIRGGHNFSVIRASRNPISACRDKIDFLLALNQDGIDLHTRKLTDSSRVIYDSDSVKPGAMKNGRLGLPLAKIMKEQGAAPIMRNSCLIGAFCGRVGIEWQVLEKVFRKHIPREIDLNLALARAGFDSAEPIMQLEPLDQTPLPVFTGNEAIGLGFIKAGLKTYVAYPMTPSSNLLHFLADVAEDFSLKVIHPESEIAVILMALGFSYVGEKAAVGTSGGGFCLMNEGLSLSGMAELPVVIVLGQRPGPSTGLPTYTSQTELHFALNAGQGEFVRFVVAPGDAEQAFYWSQVALNVSWKYQVPSIILSDKEMAEGAFSFDVDSVRNVEEQGPVLWDRKDAYKRYLDTETGISPLAFVPDKDAVIKVNSYEHDEYGITTEEALATKKIQEKRLRKETVLSQELDGYETVSIYGKRDSATALLCWGSNKGVCTEVGEDLGLRVVQVHVFSPFPERKLGEALEGVTKVISVENNATGQLARLVGSHGFSVDERISKYDGRSFSVDELKREVGDLNGPA